MGRKGRKQEKESWVKVSLGREVKTKGRALCKATMWQ